MESAIFIILAIAAAAGLLYAHYMKRRCYFCGQKVKSKKYLWLDPQYSRMVPICEDCFYDAVTKSIPEEKSAN